MKKLFFIEYMQEGSGVPVDCTIGAKTREECVQHGRKVSVEKHYCGFWILAKPPVKGVDPIRLEFHPVYQSPRENMWSEQSIFGDIVSTNGDNEVDAMCVGASKTALRKRLNEAKSVLSYINLKRFRKGVIFDFELKRLTAGDGTMALQWSVGTTSIGNVELKLLKPLVIG